jgi:3-phosphoshikimate 1-carboxyvinyltransferase
LLLAARAEGPSRITGLSGGDDVMATLEAVRQFGVNVETDDHGAVVVQGSAGLLREPVRPVDVGNSGTGIRLLAGWACGVDGLTILTGDASIVRRPMGRVTEPLRAMGAAIDGRRGGQLPPLVIRGGELAGIDYTLPVASAQVKGAILLAGLSASGQTTVREATPTRQHTEELLRLAGANIHCHPGEVTVRPSTLTPFSLDVPGDPSQAAFWLVAAAITPGSELSIERVYVGPGRAGFVDVLRRMGAEIDYSDVDKTTATATLTSGYARLRATDIGGDEVPSLIDEIPALVVAAAYAEGTTTVSDAAELRVKESDRVTAMVDALTAVGAVAEARPDGLVVQGSAGAPLAGGAVDSVGDHRVAMALAVAGLAASAPIKVDGWESVTTSYPAFEDDYLRAVAGS